MKAEEIQALADSVAVKVADELKHMECPLGITQDEAQTLKTANRISSQIAQSTVKVLVVLIITGLATIIWLGFKTKVG